MSKKAKVSPEKMHDRASLALVKGDLVTAEIWLEKALEENEQDATALAMLANVYLSRDDTQTALGLILLAIAEKPDDRLYLETFISCVGKISFTFNQFNASIANAVALCLQRNDVNKMRLWHVWYGLLSCHPELARLTDPQITFDKPDVAAMAAHPFFLAGLRELVIYNPQFENFLLLLRAALRHDLTSPSPLWAAHDLLRIAAALSHYGFFTEYILDTTAEEDVWVETQRQKLISTPAEVDAATLAVFACYDALCHLPSASVLADLFGGHEILQAVIDLQIKETTREKEISKRIPAATSIDEGVSAQVRDMYEVFPYPRWRYLPPAPSLDKAEETVPRQARILVAGCGTGHESAVIGKIFPDAVITAIDLSKSSLSYAIARAEDMGLPQISFAQGDILRLDASADKYDYIICSGVLHHMQDPVAGWRVLRGLLKPNGLMRIGLYSETGRKDIVAAREIVAAQGYGRTRKDMKTFRRSAASLLPADVLSNLQNRMDYYQLSMFCDMLFHVQEHRFDLMQIKQILDDLKLDPVKVKLQPDAEQLYREKYGAKPFSADLADWHRIEEELPEIFRNMYIFWCRAKT